MYTRSKENTKKACELYEIIQTREALRALLIATDNIKTSPKSELRRARRRAEIALNRRLTFQAKGYGRIVLK